MYVYKYIFLLLNYFLRIYLIVLISLHNYKKQTEMISLSIYGIFCFSEIACGLKFFGNHWLVYVISQQKFQCLYSD